jgi:hypothetical protein
MYVALSLQDSKFKAGLKNASQQLSQFNQSAGKYATAAAAIGGAAMTAAMGKSIMMASDLSESISKSGVVFGDSSADVEAWAKNAANAFGQSNQQALEAAGSFGGMFKVLGKGDEEAAKMSKTMVELASDLASFENTSIDEAITALGAALRGESEPIRRYKVLLDDATLKAEAFAKGLYDGKGSLTPAARAMAAYGLILKQTTQAQGDFQRTGDGLANTQRTLQAQWSNNAAVIGQSLLPAAQELANVLKNLETSGVTQKVSDSIGDWVSGLMGLFTDDTAWDLFVLNAQLAFEKIATSPGLKQIMAAFEWVANGGKYSNVGSYTDNGQIDIIQGEIDRIYQEIDRKAAEEGERKGKAARDAAPVTAPAITPPAAMPAPAAVTQSMDRPERTIDDFQRRGLSMSTDPGKVQDDLLKVQEEILKVLKDAKLKDKQLVW